ncbi:DnaB-like helicase N-terminal domain-containing protein [Pseudomonas amygdali]|uniref:DnaB-like helicase N-terminal domain-containing protein n=1 Tax=Pseudomonas amygdali TaxID=47877 RepID=UPI00373AF2EF
MSPPHSVEAEQAVLGGLMLDNESWDLIADRIKADDFFRAEHRLIFQSIAALAESSRPFDVVTVYTVVFRMEGDCSRRSFMEKLTETFADHEVEILEIQAGNKLVESGGL